MSTPSQTNRQWKKSRLDPIPRELTKQKLAELECEEPSPPDFLVFLARKTHNPPTHPGRFPIRRSSTPTKMSKQLLFDLEVLIRKINVEGIFIPKHWKEEIVDHIFQSDSQFAKREKKGVKSGALTECQMPETLGVSETLKVLGHRHCFQDASALQSTHELLVRKLLINPNGLALDLLNDEIEKDWNRLSESPPNLEIKNLSRVWDLSGTNETRLPRKYPGVSGWRGLAMGHLRKEQTRGVLGVS